VTSETVEAALRIAETGHLTFGTLHTNSAAQTINRIIDIFPSHQQSQIRTQLSLVLEGIVCPGAAAADRGRPRVLTRNPHSDSGDSNLVREDKIHQIYSAMQTGQEKFGMQTANQSLATLYMKKLITLEHAMMASSNREELPGDDQPWRRRRRRRGTRQAGGTISREPADRRKVSDGDIRIQWTHPGRSDRDRRTHG
jgi:Tfp pilus assembly pilus retraction ATPase PilT